MKKKISSRRFSILSFLGGVFLTYLIPSIGSIFSFLFVGVEVQSQASFPRNHMARLYSRSGLGDQSLSFEVDGETVYVGNDAPGGDLKERIVWDVRGKMVSLELSGKKVFVYDAESKIQIKE